MHRYNIRSQDASSALLVHPQRPLNRKREERDQEPTWEEYLRFVKWRKFEKRNKEDEDEEEDEEDEEDDDEEDEEDEDEDEDEDEEDDDEEASSNHDDLTSAKSQATPSQSCPVCMETAECGALRFFPCAHWLCAICIQGLRSLKCPVCRHNIAPALSTNEQNTIIKRQCADVYEWR